MKWSIQLILLFCSLFLIMLGFGMVIPLLPFVTRDLGGSSVDMGLLVTVWAGAQFISAPRWGTFSDRSGRRPAIMLGLTGFGLSFILMGLATEMWILYLARALGGLLSASTLPSAQAYIADTTTSEERAQAMGLLGAAFGLGFMLGPSIGGLLAVAGVRFAFFAAAGLGLTTAFLVYLFLPEPENRSVSAGEGTSAVRAVTRGLAKPYAILFVIPFCLTFGGSALFSMMGLYLMDRFAAAETEVGLAFTVMGAASALTQGLILRPALKALGEIRALHAGMLVATAGFVLLIMSPNLPVFLLCVAVVGMGMSLGRPVVASLLSRITDMGQGVTMGLQSSFDAMGRMLGPLWAGMLYSFHAQAPFISSAVVFLLITLTLRKAQVVVDQSTDQVESAD